MKHYTCNGFTGASKNYGSDPVSPNLTSLVLLNILLSTAKIILSTCIFSFHFQSNYILIPFNTKSNIMINDTQFYKLKQQRMCVGFFFKIILIFFTVLMASVVFLILCVSGVFSIAVPVPMISLYKT